MKKLDEVQWGEFFMEEVTDILNGVRLTKEDMTKGLRPFIGASELNNGVTMYVSNSNESLDCNVLGVNYNGSVGFSFYHPYKALFSDDVKRVVWKRKDKNNKYTLLFLSTSIKQQKSKFAYGYKFNGQRMKRQKLLLPITPKGEPDWQFMEDYMKQKEKKMLEPTIEYLKKRLSSKELINVNGGGKWHAFCLSAIFTINATQSGIDKNKLSGEAGDYPYITRTDRNNGWDSLIDEQAYSLDVGNVLSVGLDTQTAFYQPTPFYTGQNIQVLSNEYVNKYVALFIIPLLKKQLEKFSWGSNGATLSRLRRSTILLPTDADGELDYDFMERYMREVESKQIVDYLERII
jgi:hypothetical protein